MAVTDMESSDVPRPRKQSSFEPTFQQSTSHYTIIHDKVYDFTGFSHPGGPIAIGLAKGRDATGLFESYHSMMMMERGSRFEAVLRKYEVTGADSLLVKQLREKQQFAADPFDWTGSDAFEREAKDIMFAHLKQEAARRNVTLAQAMKATPRRWAEVVLLSLAAVTALGSLVAGWWPALLVGPLLAWLASGCFWHDGSHFSMSTNWRVNALMVYLFPFQSSALVWYHQHVVGHHVYTNVPRMDPDLYHAPRLWRFQSSLRWNPWHGRMHFTTPILWALSMPTLLFLKPIQSMATGLVNRATALQALSPGRLLVHILGRLLMAYLVFGWPFHVFAGDWFKAAIFATVPTAVHSLLFMICTQVNHHADETSEASHSNWFRHQVMTSHNVAPQDALTFYFMGGLNVQIEHHMFPGVNPIHLKAVQPLMEDAARRHGVPYLQSRSLAEALGRLWSHIAGMARDPKQQ